MATPQEWADRLAKAEQRIVNVAYGLSTESNARGVARQIERLCEAVKLHHDLLGEAVQERPTMAYEISQVRAEGGPR